MDKRLQLRLDLLFLDDACGWEGVSLAYAHDALLVAEVTLDDVLKY